MPALSAFNGAKCSLQSQIPANKAIKAGRLRLFHPGGSVPIVSLNAPTGPAIKSDLNKKPTRKTMARARGSGPGSARGDTCAARGAERAPGPSPAPAELSDGFHTHSSAKPRPPLPPGHAPSAGLCPPPSAARARHRGIISATALPPSHPCVPHPWKSRQCTGKGGRAFPHQPLKHSRGNEEGMRFRPPKIHCHNKCFAAIPFLPARRFLILS